jgi:hypothetical protein
MASPQGKNHYKHRGPTVEPIFGQIKTIQNPSIIPLLHRRG